MFLRRNAPEVIGFFTLVFFGILLLVSMRFKTPTWDEPMHYSYGARMLEKGRQTQVTLSSMAVNQLNVLPNFYLRGDRVHRPATVRALFASRVPTVLGAVLLGGVVFAFAKRLFGRWAGLGSLIVFCLCPTVLAHSRWVTNDVYCALFMISTIYAFWRYMETDRYSWLVICGLLFGAAQVSKFTSLLLIPILGFLWAVFRFRKTRILSADQPVPGNKAESEAEPDDDAHKKTLSEKLRGPMYRFAVFALCGWLVWNGAYYFQETFSTWRSRDFDSGFMKTAQKMLGPVPAGLPGPYLDALDVTFAINQAHTGRGLIYMLGETSREGFRSYFFVALLYKAPLGFWLIFLLSLFFAFYRKRSWGPPSARIADVVLLTPAVFLLIYFVFFCTAQIGVRYLMPLLVLMQVSTGRLWSPDAMGKTGAVSLMVSGAAVLWMGISSLSYTPHYLSYFNELAGGPTRSYRILADSNLDWNQNDLYVQRWLKRRNLTKDVLHPSRPATGTWVVSANRLVGIHRPAEYRWLRELEPSEHIAYSHFVFNVDEKDLRRALLVDQGKLFPARFTESDNTARGIWRFGYDRTSVSGRFCSQKPVSFLNIRRICGRTEHYAARFVGFLKIPKTGEYTLSLGSDDGSRLFLNGKRIIDLWSDHALMYDHAVLNLEQGFHSIEIHYYERTGAAALHFRLSEFPEGKILPLTTLFYRTRTPPQIPRFMFFGLPVPPALYDAPPRRHSMQHLFPRRRRTRRTDFLHDNATQS